MIRWRGCSGPSATRRSTRPGRPRGGAGASGRSPGGRREWFEPRINALLDAQTAERALRQLPADSREIVVLRIWSGLGFAQIARVTGLGVSTVHDRYVAALEQLRHALEKPCPTTTTTTNPAD